MSQDLDDLIRAAAAKAIADGLQRDQIDDHYGGNVHRWCRQNVKYRQDTEFFVVFLVGCELSRQYQEAEK